MKDEFMARHPESPFVAGRVPFHDLRYFPPDPEYRVRATLRRIAVPGGGVPAHESRRTGGDALPREPQFLPRR